MQDKLLYAAINEVLNDYNIKAQWKETKIKEIDGILNLDYKGNKETFYVEIKKEIRNFQLPKIFNLAENYKPFLVIAENLFPTIKNEFRKQGIAFIDMKGNVFIETDKILIKIEGNQQKYIQPEKQGRAFTKAGIRTIFLCLLNEDYINATYREIAGIAKIGLGNVKFILDGLVEEGYALRKNEKNLQLTNKKELLQKWITAYNEKLKPSLHLGNLRFTNQEDFYRWKNLVLDQNQTVWGGEAAGNILTDYLAPEILTLYTTERKVDLMKKYRLLPDNKGNVKIYTKFWKQELDYNETVPPLLAYADLMITGDRRCVETAQKIYERYLENTI
jgi:hypothetical protein